MRRIPPIVFLLLLVATYSCFAQRANKGIIDLRGISLSSEMVSLRGAWEFHPNELLKPKDFPTAKKEFISFPSTWSGYDFGTYRLIVLIDYSITPKKLSIEVPSLYTSYQLWVDSKPIGSNGKVGTTKETTSPRVNPKVYSFDVSSDTIELVLQVSNFYLPVGGAKESCYMGSPDLVEGKLSSIKKTDYILFFVLILIGLVSLCFYYITYKNRAPFLLLTLFVLVWFVRSAFCNQYRILDWVEVDWTILMKIEYLGVYLTTTVALLFLSSLFPQDFKDKKLKWGYIISCLSFMIFTLFTEPLTFTKFLWIYLAVSISLVFYVLYVIIKAFIYERGGAAIMLVTIFLGALTFGYVIVAYSGLIELNVLIYNLNFIILFSFLTISVSVRLSKMDSMEDSDILTMDHFYNKDTVL